jgi:hypothetical protein
VANRKEYTPHYPDLWNQARMDELVTRWTREVWDKQEDVDPNNESRWGDLAMGFALGNSLSPDQAVDFELYVAHLRLI